MPKDSIFRDKKSSRNSKGPRASALNESRVWKIRNFQSISRRILETVQDRIGRPKLLLMTNRKLHTPFRLVTKSTTLDDLERQIGILLQKRCVFRIFNGCKLRSYFSPFVDQSSPEPTTKELNVERPILSAAEM